MNNQPWIILSDGDTVAAGPVVDRAPATREKIDPGHRFALYDIVPCRRTTTAVGAGDPIHNHDLHFENGRQAVAGKKTKSKAFGCGNNEFAAWHLGATL